MKLSLLLLFIAYVSCQSTSANVSQLIAYWGYPVQEYTTRTMDGYGLSIQRIPPSNVAMGVVMLQHGLLDTSATWVLNSPTESLAFILADQGYDVWLVNSRGNQYSPVPNNADSSWWDWNWDQHAAFDIPAAIHFIINQTGVPSISVIGHSQGATITLAALSMEPNLNNKVNGFIALAPVTYLKQQSSPLLNLMAKLHADNILKLFGNGPFILTPSILSKLLGNTCEITPGLCDDVLASLFGVSNSLNSSRMNEYTSHWPDRTSVQNMIHWIENARSGSFAKYQNGADYDISTITTPTAVFYGTNDFLADPQDVVYMSNQLKTLVSSPIEVESFSHMDFVWSDIAFQQVYPQILKILSGF